MGGGEPADDGSRASVPAVLGSLKALAIQPIVVDSAFVREHLKKPGFAIVDARAKTLYDGVQTGGSTERPHKTGHIDGAVSVPFSEITNGASQFKSVDELKALFEAAGVKPGETVVVYCHIGHAGDRHHLRRTPARPSGAPL